MVGHGYNNVIYELKNEVCEHSLLIIQNTSLRVCGLISLQQGSFEFSVHGSRREGKLEIVSANCKSRGKWKGKRGTRELERKGSTQGKGKGNPLRSPLSLPF